MHKLIFSGPVLHISIEWLHVQYCFNSIFRYTARPNIWDNLQQVLSVHGSFEEFALADDNVETSEHLTDGDIFQNELKELEPEQDNDDGPNDDPDGPVEQDPDYNPNMCQLLHMVNHQKAFLQQNKFPVEVLWQLEALEQAIICHQVKTCNKQQSLMAFFK